MMAAPLSLAPRWRGGIMMNLIMMNLIMMNLIMMNLNFCEFKCLSMD